MTEIEDAVVVLGCTANPPHQGHLHCTKAGAAEAERLGYNVLFSTIAAAPFGYVRGKVKDGPDGFLLDDTMRLGLLKELMVSVGPELKKFHVPTRAYGSALECGRALRPSESVTVIVVVGGDRFKWNSKPVKHPDLVTLCCARGAEQFSQLNTALSQGIQEGRVSEPSKWRLMASVGPATSSTLIRSIILDDQTVRIKSGTNWQNMATPKRPYLCFLTMYWTREPYTVYTIFVKLDRRSLVIDNSFDRF